MLEILFVCQMFHNAISMNSLLFRSMSILLALLRRRHSDSQDNNEIQRTFLLYTLRLYLCKQSLYRTAHTQDPFTKRLPKKPPSLATQAVEYISVHVAVSEVREKQ